MIEITIMYLFDLQPVLMRFQIVRSYKTNFRTTRINTSNFEICSPNSQSNAKAIPMLFCNCSDAHIKCFGFESGRRSG